MEVPTGKPKPIEVPPLPSETQCHEVLVIALDRQSSRRPAFVPVRRHPRND